LYVADVLVRGGEVELAARIGKIALGGAVRG
jgi:hypothetical protein